MNIFLDNQIRSNETLLNVLFGKKTQKTKVSQNIGSKSRMDTATISEAGKQMAVKRYGRTKNTQVDKTIDLQKYVDEAAKKNQEVLDNAGTEINAKYGADGGKYTRTSEAFRNALTEKYEKLVSEAKTHADPESHIRRKYFDKGYEYYETDLTETERRIAYNNEKRMYECGKIDGVSYEDSLFRGIEISGDVVDADAIKFERQLVNRQISNILTKAGVNTEQIPDSCTFSVNPYSYEISVEGVSEDLKVRMENALNVGNNGKNLFKHIYKCATQDGVDSTQITKESKMKYEAYQQVYSFTGLQLDKLTEKNGTYYTDDGKNVLDITDEAIDNSGNVPKDFKQQMKDWIRELVSGVSLRGWNNIPDMTLSIFFTKNGLEDMNQSVLYTYNKENSLEKPWYSVM